MAVTSAGPYASHLHLAPDSTSPTNSDEALKTHSKKYTGVGQHNMNGWYDGTIGWASDLHSRGHGFDGQPSMAE